MKIERDIVQKLEETDVSAALVEAGKKRHRPYDDDCCSCHINPPCSYCTSHAECALCNQMVLNDDMVEFNNDWVCEECSLAAEEE